MTQPFPLRLDGRIAVVTGGSSGIGAACVRALAAEGASVVIGYHSGLDRAQALLAQLPGKGHVAMPIPLGDGAAHADLETMDGALFNEILVANAGGPFSITRALMPLLRASGDAVVISVSSISAFTGSGSNIAYCAAKAALDTMTLSLARAIGPGVRFLCVSPAAVDTGFVEGRSRAELEKKAVTTPLGRIVTPEDVALAVLA